MEKGFLNEVKAILKSLVISCPDKMTVDNLNRDYRDVEGEAIPFRRLGYKDIDQFLHSIPDTLRIYGSGPTAMVCFVPNEKTDHIHDMIMEQKKPNRRRRRSKSKKSTPGRANNRFCNNTPSRRMPGQQLSAFQSTKINHMTNTLTVWNAPSQLSSVSKYPNHKPPCFSNQWQYTGYQLPQPVGINNMSLIKTQPGTMPKIDKRPIIGNMNKNEQVTQLTSLMTSCHITTPSKKESQAQSQIACQAQPQLKTLTSPVLQTQTAPVRNVAFSSATKTMDQTTKVLNGGTTPKIFTGVQPAEQTKPKINIFEDMQRSLTGPARSVLNPVREYCDFNISDQNNDKVLMKEKHNIHTKPNDVIKELFDISDEKVNDLDEAVPLFAANNIVYRLDFPDHAVPYGLKIAPAKLPDCVHVGAVLKIFISEIHNPFKFWFHLHKDDHELDRLMYQIEQFYGVLDTDELQIPMLCLTPGQTCAACYNRLWHRAEILATPVNNKLKVLFVDYGTVSDVNVKDIKFLATSFAQLPAQALRGCLSHIKPRLRHWSHEATTYFLSLVSDLMLYAKITEIDRVKQVAYMVLCDTNDDEDIQINLALVRENHASCNVDWLECNIKRNNDKRLHHPREDFPTFSMIELGEYPSFSELVDLQQRGIDYEAIYDQIIFNKTSILNKHENAPAAIRKLPYFLTTTNPFRLDIIMELNGMFS